MTDNTTTKSGWGDSVSWTTGFSVAGGLANSIMGGYSAGYQAKAQAQNNIANAYAGTIPQFQQIGSQIRQQQQQQAIAYTNSGVDPSKGTADYVIQRTGEYGTMKMQEIYDNVNQYVDNQRRMGDSSSKSAIAGGYAQGFVTMAQELANYSLQQQKNKNLHDIKENKGEIKDEVKTSSPKPKQNNNNTLVKKAGSSDGVISVQQNGVTQSQKEFTPQAEQVKIPGLDNFNAFTGVKAMAQR
jgi:uncharacterized protein YegP (UPF0339 family)